MNRLARRRAALALGLLAGLGSGGTARRAGATPATCVPVPAAEQAFAAAYLPLLAHAVGFRAATSVPLCRAEAATLHQVLLGAMARQYPGETLERMGAAYQAIGLLPAGTNLREEALALYQGQVVGFYDPLARRLALMADAEPSSREQVLRHELMHALQDQRVPLAAETERVAADDDQALAWQAVLEGQAMLAMQLDLLAAKARSAPAAAERAAAERSAQAVRTLFDGTDVNLSPDEVDVLSHAQEQQAASEAQQKLEGLADWPAGAAATAHTAAHAATEAAGAAAKAAGAAWTEAQSAVGESMANMAAALGLGEPAHASVTPAGERPAYLEAQLTFPYVEGRAFIEHLAEQSGLPAAMATSLARPPRTTHEVLHPAAYGHVRPPLAPLPIERRAGATVLWHTSVGELNLRTLVRSCPQAAWLAGEWRADRLAYVALEQNLLTAWRVRLKDSAAAASLAACLDRIVPHKRLVARHAEVGLLAWNAGAPPPAAALSDALLF